MASVITIAGEQLFAAKAQANEQLDIDTFIFANVPNQDPNTPINREEGIPTAHIVYQQNVQQVGRINDNVVVYSTVLDSITGPFEFNWVGLYSSVNQKLVAINHVPTVTKTATAQGAAGNTLNRNFGIEYSGIAELTGITVDAGTWQLDFTARLSGMDLLTQQLAADMNGKDWFIADGLKVVPRTTANSFSVTPGVGYVSGLRVELKQEHILIVQSYPQFVYVDAWFSGNANSTWSPQLAFTVTNTEMDDYVDPSGAKHYVYKLAVINAADDVEDLRRKTAEEKKQIDEKYFSDFGVAGLGMSDDSIALQAAFDWAGAKKGRKIKGFKGEKYRITQGITMRFDNKYMDPTSACEIDFSGTEIIADANNIVAVKIARNYVTLIKPEVFNHNNRIGVTAYALAPENEESETIRCTQMYCSVEEPTAHNCHTFMRFRPGATVNGQNSGSFYHIITSPKAFNCEKMFHFARTVSGDSLTTRVTIYTPMHLFGNCTFDLEAVDSMNVYSGSCEFINGNGEFENAPTIKVHKPVATDSLSTSNVRFINFTGEVGKTPYDITGSESISMPGTTFFGYENRGKGQDDYPLSTMQHNLGPLISLDRYGGVTPMVGIRREKATNQNANGQAYMAMESKESNKAILYSDGGFKCVSKMEQVDIRTPGPQMIGGSGQSVQVGGSGEDILLYNASSAGNGRFFIGGSVAIGPNSDISTTAGTPALRYNTVYAQTGAINTSDAREKTVPLEISEQTLDAWADVSLISFQWLSAIQDKGELARWHFGVIAQNVRDSFIAHNLDGTAYGLLCYDEWDEESHINKDGEKVIDIKAGHRWGIRADQCLFLEAALQRRTAQRLNERLTFIESRLAEAQ